MSKKRIIIICLVLIISMFCSCVKKEQEKDQEIRIDEYTIKFLMEETFAKEAANELQKRIQEKCGFILRINEETEEDNKKIIYVGNKILAEEKEIVISAIGEMGYCIINEGEKIYIYANSEKGFNRAFHYIKEYISEEGIYLGLKEKRILDTAEKCLESISIGEKMIEEYKIAIPEEPDIFIRKAAEEVQSYIVRASGILIPIEETKTPIKKSIQIQAINVVSENSDFTYKNTIAYGKVQILGKDGEACLAGVYDFINTYLGWSYAGELKEKLNTRVKNLKIPETVLLFEDRPWMEEREAIICLWKTNNSRGVYLNQNTSMLCDLMSYSEEQLCEYVRMLKHCGFTGIQITEMCSAWAGSGDYEYVHERIRILADAAHSMGMKVTLWVWGAEFNGYGWTDPSVQYIFEGYDYLKENPRTLEFFDKYCSIYAELGDCVDRVIAHYYDPGNLYVSEDVAFYAKMLKDKMQAVNPEIDFGVNCWVDAFDKDILVEGIGNDITIYETSHWDTVSERVDFRNKCDELGCRLGTWSWGTCEMEIDQLAQMNVNANFIQQVYLQAMEVDTITTKPSYWSEMDSYHVLNVFSLYCAGHLLANPTADTEMLLKEVAYNTVGEKHQNDFYEMLDLIQDARTGDTKESFGWGNDNYVLRSDAYNPEEILDRCNICLPVLDQMIEEGIEAYMLPLPIDLQDVLKLIRPHLEQIKKFAEFKIGLIALEEKFLNGEKAEILSSELNELYKPIPEYNCIIGLWGQIEARMQYFMVEEFCEKAKIKTPMDETFNRFRKMRMYQQLCDFQRGKQEPFLTDKTFYQWGKAFGTETTIELTDELVEEGLFVENEDGFVYLKDWENYIYDFK